MDESLVHDLSKGAAGLLAPLIDRLSASADDHTAAADRPARRLWRLLGAYAGVSHAAHAGGRRPGEALAGEIGRLLEIRPDLADQVASLLADAEAAGSPVPGLALAERTRAGRDLHVTGAFAGVRHAEASRDITVEATPPPAPKGSPRAAS